jgi:GTP cyclohydrolase I
MNQGNPVLKIADNFRQERSPENISMQGTNHVPYQNELPNRLSPEEKIRIISSHFSEIMRTLGLDMNDDTLKGTPGRVAKMFVKEIFSGLNPENKPRITLFNNKYKYHQMLIEKDITLLSYCERHFVPIIGKVHLAYIPNGKVIGLSKLNRLVQYYSKRPQVQERLTNQIAEGLKETLNIDDVAVLIDAMHLCVASRGIQDTHSSTVTVHYSGKFFKEEIRNEFLAIVK